MSGGRCRWLLCFRCFQNVLLSRKNVSRKLTSIIRGSYIYKVTIPPTPKGTPYTDYYLWVGNVPKRNAMKTTVQTATVLGRFDPICCLVSKMTVPGTVTLLWSRWPHCPGGRGWWTARVSVACALGSKTAVLIITLHVLLHHIGQPVPQKQNQKAPYFSVAGQRGWVVIDRHKESTRSGWGQ